MKKILFFTYDFPYPPNSGGKSRAYNLLKHAKDDMDITLFSFVRGDFDEKNLRGMEEIGVKKIKIFERKNRKGLFDPRNIFTIMNYNSSVFKKLYFTNKILGELETIVVQEKVDIIHFESYYTSFFIHEKLRKNNAKILFGEENIEYKIYEEYAKKTPPFPLRPLFLFEAKKIKREEEKCWKNSDACLAVLDEEAKLIEKVSSKKCFVVENGVDLEYFSFPEIRKKRGKNILFVGNFSYFPNVHAVNLFYKNVFKKLQDEEIKFVILGKDSSKLPFINDNKVNVIEYVKDIRDIYYESDVFVFPVKYGGGTNFKILEAMAAGVPVVAYPDRIKSMNLVGEEEVLIAKSDNEFYDQITRVLNDEELRSKITKNARELVEEKYSWSKIGKKLNNIWREL